MNRTYLFLLILFFVSSCKGQEYGHGIFDLNKITFNIDVQKFYAESLNRKHINIEDDQQFVEKHTLKGMDLQHDSDPQKIVAIQYDVKKYSDEDTVAVFNDVYFCRLSAMTDEKNNLMMLSAISNCNADSYTKLIQKLSREFGKPEISEQSTGFLTHNVITWQLADRVIQIISEYKLDFKNGSVILNAKEKQMITDVVQDRLKETHLFLCSPKYVKQLRGQLHSGEWLYFN